MARSSHGSGVGPGPNADPGGCNEGDPLSPAWRHAMLDREEGTGTVEEGRGLPPGEGLVPTDVEVGHDGGKRGVERGCGWG